MPANSPIRCPDCNRLGSNDADIRHLCKACLAKKICVQCGEPAYKYLERSPYHSWYCKFHYERKLQEFTDEPLHILRDTFAGDSAYTKQDVIVSESDEVGLIKSEYGYEV